MQSRVACACLVFALLSAKSVIAQSEAANWILSGDYSIRFTNNGYEVVRKRFSNTNDVHASYSNSQGELILYSDGAQAYNDKGEVVRNGSNLGFLSRQLMIVPKPGAERVYYLFGLVPTGPQNVFANVGYAVIDMKLNGGRGEVVETNQSLITSMHGTFSVVRGCGDEDLWLLSEHDRNMIIGTDQIVLIRIGKNGISQPYTYAPQSIGNSSGYRFSPDGKKVIYQYRGNGPQGFVIADFRPDLLPDKFLDNQVMIDNCCGRGEFSPDGAFVYYQRPDSQGKDSFFQYNVATGETTLLSEEGALIGYPQLAPDGKVYAAVTRTVGNDQVYTLAVVAHPEKAGLACGFQIDAIATGIPNYPYLPSFSTNLFFDGPADAGEDQVVCPGVTIAIGGMTSAPGIVTWEPPTYLDDPHKLRPSFTYTGYSEEEVNLTYRLKLEYNGCTDFDEMNIKVLPGLPPPSIIGPASVCPSARGIKYWTDVPPAATYSWAVTGGTIRYTASPDTILIDWGTTNPNAQVYLETTNEYACRSSKSDLDVVINVELDTQTPFGLQDVCDNLLMGNRYEVIPANGSIYEWGITGGAIRSGQGTHRVVVHWGDVPGLGIWVKEKSTTIDTVCYGASDTLRVNVFKDPALLPVDFVTVAADDERAIELQATPVRGDLIRSLTIFGGASDQLQEIWKQDGVADLLKYRVEDLYTDDSVYRYRVDIRTACQRTVSSEVHHSMLLTAAANEGENRIRLEWNPYDFALGTPSSYEIWRSLESNDRYERIASSIASPTYQTTASDGFVYYFRVKAIRADGVFEAWSNEVRLGFSHAIFIPNVLTPNGDGYNDTFFIKYIHLYPQNQLNIFDRNGTLVYTKTGYNNEWDGGGLPAGVYYYTLTTSAESGQYKGWVHLIR